MGHTVIGPFQVNCIYHKKKWYVCVVFGVGGCEHDRYVVEGDGIRGVKANRIELPQVCSPLT